jgi:hypothetical protein
VRLKLRGIAGRDLEAAVPRQVLQRLVLGHDADLTPDRPLPGLSPGAKVLAGAAHLMVLQPRERSLPPWTGPRAPQAGEENAARLAAALGRWWLGEEGAQAPRVFVGTDAQRSIERWRGVSGLAARPLLLLPEDAFPGTAAPLRAQLAGLWKAGEVAPALPAGQAPGLVVLVSAEEPALLGARLRELAVNGAMKGRLLAVYPLGGPVRPDLPASLLAEGRLSGIGISEYNPLEAGRITQRLQALAAALAAPDARQKRPEDLPPPLLWYF